MRHLTTAISILVTLASGAASAAPILWDTVYAKDGREWAQLDRFFETSWLRLDRQCPDGPCLPGSEMNNWSLEGWNWASAQEVQDLFNAYTGHSAVAPTGYQEINSTWAPEFTSVFRLTSGIAGRNEWVHGWTSTQPSSTRGFTAVLFNGTGGPVPNDAYNTDIAYTFTISRSWLGAWFWREPRLVPIPGSLSLLAAGVMALLLGRRRRA
ncbi:MAG: hypothetical protein HKN19_09275 [Halioglobus sp.]|nr:hypothetical protein [Halioglobus sp.]